MIVRAGAIVALLLMPLGSKPSLRVTTDPHRGIMQRGQILRREIFGTGGRDVRS